MANQELERYIPLADMIAKTFGKNCEVVIHDLSMPQSSVVYAVNNHVSGRQVGQSFNHLIKDVLLSKNFAGDYTANYPTVTADQKKMKSSTALLRNQNDEVVGALCINYALQPLQDMLAFLTDFLAIEESPVEKEAEPFASVTTIVDDLIDKIIGTNDVEELKRKDKIALIQFMDKKDLFLIKGVIEKVAEKLHISKVTVYSYLEEIRKEKQPPGPAKNQ